MTLPEIGFGIAAKQAREESIAGERKRCPFCEIFVRSCAGECTCVEPCSPDCPLHLTDVRPPVPRFAPRTTTHLTTRHPLEGT